jgi:hypothetical protein
MKRLFVLLAVLVIAALGLALRFFDTGAADEPLDGARARGAKAVAVDGADARRPRAAPEGGDASVLPGAKTTPVDEVRIEVLVQNLAGEPIERARVRVEGEAGLERNPVDTDREGLAVIHGAIPRSGLHELRVSASAAGFSRGEAIVSWSSRTGEGLSCVVVLAPASRIRGRVCDDKGRCPEGTVLRLDPLRRKAGDESWSRPPVSPPRELRPDAEGQFEFAGLPPKGRFSLAVSLPDGFVLSAPSFWQIVESDGPFLELGVAAVYAVRFRLIDDETGADLPWDMATRLSIKESSFRRAFEPIDPADITVRDENTRNLRMSALRKPTFLFRKKPVYQTGDEYASGGIVYPGYLPRAVDVVCRAVGAAEPIVSEVRMRRSPDFELARLRIPKAGRSGSRRLNVSIRSAHHHAVSVYMDLPFSGGLSEPIPLPRSRVGIGVGAWQSSRYYDATDLSEGVLLLEGTSVGRDIVIKTGPSMGVSRFHVIESSILNNGSAFFFQGGHPLKLTALPPGRYVFGVTRGDTGQLSKLEVEIREADVGVDELELELEP